MGGYIVGWRKQIYSKQKRGEQRWAGELIVKVRCCLRRYRSSDRTVVRNVRVGLAAKGTNERGRFKRNLNYMFTPFITTKDQERERSEIKKHVYFTPPGGIGKKAVRFQSAAKSERC